MVRRLRLVSVATVLLIAFPAVAGQAAAPAPRPLPASDIIEVTPKLPADKAPQKAVAPTAEKPTIMRDKGIEAMGGLDAFLDLESRMKTAAPAAKVAAAPAPTPAPEKATTPKIITRVDPREQPAQPATAAAAAQAVTAPAPVARHLDVQPHTAAADEPILPYTLAPLTSDVVQSGGPRSVQFMLQHDGVAVAGATVSVPDLSATGVTGSSGLVTLAFQAPDHNLQAGVYVTDGASLADAWLGDIYVVEPGYGVVTVSEFTGHDGAPVTSFWADFYDPSGTYGRWSRQAKVGLILPADGGHGTVYIGADNGTYGTQLDYGYIVTAGERVNLHPTAETARLVQVKPYLNDTPVPAVVSVARNYVDGALPHRHPTNLYLSWGNYELLTMIEAPEATYIVTSSLYVGSVDQSPSVAFNPANLATVQYSGSDGFGHPLQLPVVFRSWQAQAVVLNPALPVKVLSYYNYRPAASYGTTLTADQDSYSYRFTSASGWMTVYPAVDYPITLGGPVHPSLAQQFSTARAGDLLQFDTSLLTTTGDALAVSVTHDGVTAPLTGTFRLRDGAGNLVSEQTVVADQQTVSVRLPGNARGTFTASLDYDLGPYQGAVHGESAFSVYEPPVLAVSPEIVSPYAWSTITMTLTAGGQPRSGATLQVGWSGQYGSYTTDAAGQATFALPPFYGPDAIPIYVQGSGYLGYIYVVPDGWGAVAVGRVTDQNGQSVAHRGLTMTGINQVGGMIHSGFGSGDDIFGTVVPAGTASLEVAADSGSTGLFLYQQIAVEPGKRVDVQPSGAGAQLLTVTASIDGNALGGARAWLHNRAMSEPSRYGHDVPLESFVTPGAYDMLIQSDGPSALLYQSGVDLHSPAQVILAGYSDGLARLETGVQDGHNVSISMYDRIALRVGSIELSHFSWEPQNYQITPGIPWQVVEYDLNVWGEDSALWSYRFGGGDPMTPEPGQTVALQTGGPLTLSLTPVWYDYGGSRDVALSLTNAAGHRLREVTRNPPDATAGTVELRSSSGTVLWSDAFTVDWGSVMVPWPTDPGTYTLVADIDLGPYQGAVHGETTITVEEPLTVALSVDHVPVGEQTPVTVTATHGSQPAAGVAIDIDYGRYQGTTDANGQVTFGVFLPYSTAMRVAANQQFGAFLFALTANEAGIDMLATDVDGFPLDNFNATVETADSYSYTSISYGDNGRAAAVAPAGTVLVSLATWFPRGYFLNRTVQAAPGIVQHVYLDGRASVAVPFAATLDGAQFSGTLQLRPVGQRESFTNADITLLPTGSAVAHVTPGEYAALVEGSQPEGALAGIVQSLNLTGGPVTLGFERSQLGEIDVSINRGASAGDLRLLLLSGGFEIYIYEPAGHLLVTPGTYQPTNLWYHDTQPDATDWRFHLYRFDLEYSVAAGQTVAADWDMTPGTTTVKISPSQYDPGDYLYFHMMTLAVSGWIYDEVVQTTPTYEWVAGPSARITDAAGSEVYSADSLYISGSSWQVPGNPSSSYTISMRRDMGTEGVHEAAATVSQVIPLALRLSLQIVPVGQATPVSVVMTAGGRPAPGVIQVGNQVRSTGPRGDARFQIKATASGPIEVCGEPYDGSWTCTYIYALTPALGLIDVRASSADGSPLDYTAFQAIGGLASGFSSWSERRMAIVPAGPARVLARSSAANGDVYYQVLDVIVPAMGIVSATADGTRTEPLSVHTSIPNTSWWQPLYLRRTDLAYDEDFPLQVRPVGSFTIYASPGNYQYVLGGEDQDAVLTGSFDLPAAGEMTLDASAATAVLTVSPHDGTGQVLSTDGAGVEILSGRIRFYVDAAAPIHLTPGAYRIVDAYLKVPADGMDWGWQYQFKTSLPISLAAGHEQTVSVGGPLQLPINVPAQALVNTNVSFVLAPQDASGFTLVAPWSGRLEITGPNGYRAGIFLSGSGTTTWQAPAGPGHYIYHLTITPPDYGQTLDLTGAIDVIRLSPRR